MPDHEFKLGFRAVADELGAAVVGTPLEPEQSVLGGNYQTTTTGLMFWSKVANRPMFLPSANKLAPPPPPVVIPGWAPIILSRPSPHFVAGRPRTVGCVMHSTNGGTSTHQADFVAAINWFSNPSSQVSAHIVIGPDGTIAECVDPANTAWHVGFQNSEYLGIELAKPAVSSRILDPQLKSAAWWLIRQSKRFGFPLTAERLPEHRQTTQGKAAGKSDIGGDYSYERLAKAIRELGG
jgi:hypothetical protein